VDEQIALKQRNDEIQRARLASFIRWSAKPMLVVTVFMVLLAWAATIIGNGVEPRWMWVTTDARYEHLVRALDAHAPGWTKSETLAAALMHPSDEQPVNWVMGLVPVSEHHFLVTQQADDQVSLELYPATSANAEYWARRMVGAVDGEPPEPTSVVTIPADLARGRHRMDFPALFHPRDEIIATFTTTNRAIEPWKWGFGPTCLLIAWPRASEIEVVPMTWHAEDQRLGRNSDIERLFRDPSTGRLFGDGSHLRAFVLKEDPRELDKWLR
jgi:hypothetical protein